MAVDATLGVTDLVEVLHARIVTPQGPIAPALRLLPSDASPQGDALLATLNSVLGDYLAASGNPLAQAMTLRAARPVQASDGGGILLLHGLCMNDLQWQRQSRGWSSAGN